MKEINTKENCIIDARVSSDRQLLGGGIENQLEACLYFVGQRNWNPLLTYTKPYSGRKEEREDFKKILSDIRNLQKNGTTVHHYIFASIDRLTRTGSEGYSAMKREIMKLGVQPVDSRGVIQPEQNTLEHHGFSYDWSSYSPTDVAQLMEAERAKSEVRDMLTRMIGAEIRLTKEGYAIGPALDGYRNVKAVIDGKEVKVWAHDEERAELFKKIFDLRAPANLSDKEIVSQLNAEGFLTKPTKIWNITEDGKKDIVGYTQPKPLTVSRLQLVVQRIGYAGVKLAKWNDGIPVWTKFADGHTPIVDIDTFNAANRGTVHIKVLDNGQPEVLYNYTKWQLKRQVRQKFRPEYQFDKMILCSACQKPLFNSGKGNRGRAGTYYKAYHCTRTEECKKVTGRIPQSQFEATVRSVLYKLNGVNNFADQLQAAINRRYQQRKEELQQSDAAVQTNVKKLKDQQDALLESFYAASSQMVREKTENRIEALEKQIVEAKEREGKIRVDTDNIGAFTGYVKNLLEHLGNTLADNRFPYEQRSLFTLIFDGLPSWLELNIGTPKLSQILGLSEHFKNSKSTLVRLDNFEWNTIEDIILEWNEVFEQNTRVKQLANEKDNEAQKTRIDNEHSL